MADADDVTYQFSMDRETWTEWTDTLPRSQHIDAHLRTLIEQDLRAATRSDDANDIEGKTLDVFATRIRIRTMHAIGALRDDDPDVAAALDQLEELSDMADILQR